MATDEQITEFQQDYGDWTYEENLDGYGPATKHVWVRERADGQVDTVKVCLSEGLHIMKCERGEWLLTVNIGSGGPDKEYCLETEKEALSDVRDLLPSI